MTLNNFKECYYLDDKHCNKSFARDNPLLTKGLLIGSTLTIASIVNPNVRKITIPTCKFLAKQQLKLLAGIGVLSIATYSTKKVSNLDNNEL